MELKNEDVHIRVIDQRIGVGIGGTNPARVSEIYDNLMEEAGLPPLEDE